MEIGKPCSQVTGAESCRKESGDGQEAGCDLLRGDGGKVENPDLIPALGCACRHEECSSLLSPSIGGVPLSPGRLLTVMDIVDGVNSGRGSVLLDWWRRELTSSPPGRHEDDSFFACRSDPGRAILLRRGPTTANRCSKRRFLFKGRSQEFEMSFQAMNRFATSALIRLGPHAVAEIRRARVHCC